MILVHKIQYRELEPYKTDYLESLRQNMSNSLITKILIFSDLDIPGLPKNNKILFSLKKGYDEVDVLKYVRNVYKNETIIWSNPYAIFNHTLMKVNSIGKGKIIQLSSHSNGLLNKGSMDTLIFDNITLDESKQTVNESLIGERVDASLNIIVNNKRPSYSSKPIQTQTKHFDIPRRNIQKETTIEKQVIDLQSRRHVAKKEDIKVDPGIKVGKIDAVIVSVDYNDFLILTLENNIKYLENITVVTSTSDTLCKEICDKFGVKCVITDRMYEDGAKFNKGKAINEGIKSIQNPEWILLLDADIIIPNNWNEIINSNIFKKDAIHICSRNIIENYDDYQRWINGEQVGKIESSKGFGYFQLFNVNSSVIFGRNPIFPETSDDAAWSDLSFRNKFNNRVDIPISVVHLGKAYSNWKGRETEIFVNDKEINRLLNKKSTYTICSYYFNFRNDKRQKDNFIKFLDQFKGYYDKMIVGIVDYGDIDFDIPCDKIVVCGDPNKKLWSKEILINKIIEKIDTDYLIWIDGDLIYDDLSWLDNIDSVIKGNDFIQLFKTINYLGENGDLLESHKSIISGKGDIDSLLRQEYKPGGSWMGKTSILKEKKLFEKMYVGGGDTIFIYGLFGITNGWTLGKISEVNDDIYNDAIDWIKSLCKYKISFVDLSINHLYHGELKDRNYNNRYERLSGLEFYDYDFCIVISTFNRSNMLKSLLSDIFSECGDYKLHIVIFDDGSYYDYSPIVEMYNVKYIKYITNNGKKGYWKLIDDSFKYCKSIKSKYFIYLPDDVGLKNGFFDESVRIFEKIDDRDKMCLNLLMDETRRGRTNWTGFNPIEYDEYYMTQWCDLCFISKKEMLTELKYQITEISSSRWDNNPDLGSGVGQQISTRLLNNKKNMYHVINTLVTHDDHDSVMNYNNRNTIKLIAK